MKRVSLTPRQAERVLEAIKSSKDDHLIGIAGSIQSQLDRIGFTEGVFKGVDSHTRP